MQRASEAAQPFRAQNRRAKASAATFLAVQAACCAWGRFSSPGDDVALWHSVNAVLAVAGVATAAWSVLASPRRGLALLAVVPLLVVCGAYLLRWEWALFIWRTRGFAP